MGGEPKAWLEVGGRPIIERVLGVVRAVADDVLLVTNTPDVYARLGLPMVPDLVPEGGSLGGIYTGLRAAAGDAAFTVACDMPFLRADVARLCTGHAGVADVVIPRVGGQLETLHACYAKACLGPMAARLERRELRITGFFSEVRVLEVAEDAVAALGDPRVVFMNVNTPAELAAARARAAALDGA
jgi:molybdopterin-guanine dinucleotide biosynthesis protein A